MKVTANIDGIRVIGTATDLGLIKSIGESSYFTEYAFGERIYQTSVSERECVKHGNTAEFRLAWDIQQLANQGVNDLTFGDREVITQSKPKMTIDDKLDALMQKLIEIDIHVAELRSTLVSTFHDEFSPERKAASDRLGQTLLTRMKGEFQAREMTAPSGAYWCEACNQPHPKGFICTGRPV